MRVAVLIPLYQRVHHMQRLSENLAKVTPDATMYIRVIPGVTPEFDVQLNMKIVPLESTRYPHGINELARIAWADAHEWLFIGADDLEFHEGWDKEALKIHRLTGAQVIGTNDLCNPRVIAGQHATHFLVHSSYLNRGTLDRTGELMSEAYLHSYVDDEIRLTASARGLYAHAELSHVEHLHPISGKTQWDETYERGSGGENFEIDAATFRKRMQMAAEGDLGTL